MYAGAIPGERIETTTRTSNSSAISTTETAIDTVTADVVSGRTYKVRYVYNWSGSVAADQFYLRTREGSGTGGTQLTYHNIRTAVTTQIFGNTLEVEWTAGSTGSQSFSTTLVRQTGTGAATIRASSTQPAYLYVDYISG